MTKPALATQRATEFRHMPAEAPRDAILAQSPTAAALYIGALTGELARLARRHRLDNLAYILDMARLEADQIAKNSGDAGHA